MSIPLKYSSFPRRRESTPQAVRHAPQEFLARPDNLVAYVSCDASKKVAAINLRTWNVDQLIDAGRSVDGLAWAKGN